MNNSDVLDLYLFLFPLLTILLVEVGFFFFRKMKNYFVTTKYLFVFCLILFVDMVLLALAFSFLLTQESLSVGEVWPAYIKALPSNISWVYFGIRYFFERYRANRSISFDVSSLSSQKGVTIKLNLRNQSLALILLFFSFSSILCFSFFYYGKDPVFFSLILFFSFFACSQYLLTYVKALIAARHSKDCIRVNEKHITIPSLFVNTFSFKTDFVEFKRTNTFLGPPSKSLIPFERFSKNYELSIPFECLYVEKK